MRSASVVFRSEACREESSCFCFAPAAEKRCKLPTCRREGGFKDGKVPDSASGSIWSGRSVIIAVFGWAVQSVKTLESLDHIISFQADISSPWPCIRSFGRSTYHMSYSKQCYRRTDRKPSYQLKVSPMYFYCLHLCGLWCSLKHLKANVRMGTIPNTIALYLPFIKTTRINKRSSKPPPWFGVTVALIYEMYACWLVLHSVTIVDAWNFADLGYNADSIEWVI